MTDHIANCEIVRRLSGYVGIQSESFSVLSQRRRICYVSRNWHCV